MRMWIEWPGIVEGHLPPDHPAFVLPLLNLGRVEANEFANLEKWDTSFCDEATHEASRDAELDCQRRYVDQTL